MVAKNGGRRTGACLWKLALAVTVLQIGPCANVQNPPPGTDLFFGMAISFGQTPSCLGLPEDPPYTCPAPLEGDLAIMLDRTILFGFPSPGPEEARRLESCAAGLLVERLGQAPNPPGVALGAIGVGQFPEHPDAVMLIATPTNDYVAAGGVLDTLDADGAGWGYATGVEGGLNLAGAIDAALDALNASSPDRRKVILIVSTGVVQRPVNPTAECDTTNPADAARCMAQVAADEGVPLVMVHAAADDADDPNKGASLMMELATISGGLFYEANTDLSEIEDALLDLFGSLICDDCNGNLVPDEVDIGSDGTSQDCNSDGIPDECQLEDNDCDTDGIPDECQVAANDCNTDGVYDACQLDDNDCDSNGVPDDCQIDDNDCNSDQVLDLCQLDGNDCNDDQTPDDCQLTGNDCDSNGMPDDCQPDSDDDGIIDPCDTDDNSNDNAVDNSNSSDNDNSADNANDNGSDNDNTSDDSCDDDDLDEVCDDEDNCPGVPNAMQTDTDEDGLGDVCDNCPGIANADQIDADEDTWGDVCDNCPDDFNPGQTDIDGDGIGDACDEQDDTPGPDDDDGGEEPCSDVDEDGVCDDVDNCPETSNPGQEDTDGDGIGDACDEDTSVEDNENQDDEVEPGTDVPGGEGDGDNGDNVDGGGDLEPGQQLVGGGGPSPCGIFNGLALVVLPLCLLGWISARAASRRDWGR